MCPLSALGVAIVDVPALPEVVKGAVNIMVAAAEETGVVLAPKNIL